MAHIPDGVLSWPVLASGIVTSLAGCAYGLKKLEPMAIPRTAVLSASFFVAALVHFPVGPTSVHLMLNGLIGLLLGWVAVPAIMIGLLLQALLFGFGGMIVLGVNTFNLALPALLCHGLFQLSRKSHNHKLIILTAGICGFLGVSLTAVLVALSLALSGKEFISAAQLVVFAHLPIMVIESVFTASAIALLLRVKPAALDTNWSEEPNHDDAESQNETGAQFTADSRAIESKVYVRA